MESHFSVSGIALFGQYVVSNRRRERSRTLDFNDSQPGLNYQSSAKTNTLQLPLLEVVVHDAHI